MYIKQKKEQLQKEETVYEETYILRELWGYIEPCKLTKTKK